MWLPCFFLIFEFLPPNQPSKENFHDFWWEKRILPIGGGGRRERGKISSLQILQEEETHLLYLSPYFLCLSYSVVTTVRPDYLTCYSSAIVALFSTLVSTRWIRCPGAFLTAFQDQSDETVCPFQIPTLHSKQREMGRRMEEGTVLGRRGFRTEDLHFPFPLLLLLLMPIRGKESLFPHPPFANPPSIGWGAPRFSKRASREEQIIQFREGDISKLVHIKKGWKIGGVGGSFHLDFPPLCHHCQVTQVRRRRRRWMES